VLLSGALVVGTQSLVLALYWYDSLEFLAVCLAAISQYLLCSFLFFMLQATKKRIFSGCSFLNKAARARVTSFSRRVAFWNVCFFVDFLTYLFLIYEEDFKSMDLYKYMSGAGFSSRLR
jgi:hypothetical protein